MLRITTILLASLAFLSAGPSDLDAGCCGGSSSSSGRAGFFSRFRVRSNAGVFRTRVRSTASYSAPAAALVPMQAPVCTVGCPCMAGGVCTCPQTTPMSQAPAVVVPQGTTAVYYRGPARAFVTGNCPTGVCPISR